MFIIGVLAGLLLSRIEAATFPTSWECGDVGVTCTANHVTRIDYPNDVYLTGSIPSTIGLYTTLTAINIRVGPNYNIKGTLPSEIGNLINLASFTLLDSTLTGSIPSSFSKLTNLKRFNVRRNRFCGGYPQELRVFCPYPNCWSGVISNSDCPSASPLKRPTSAPKRPTSAPKRPTSAPKRPTSAPKRPTAAPTKLKSPSAAPSAFKQPPVVSSKATLWNSHGGNLFNTRHLDASTTKLSRSNLKLQKPSYFWNTGGSVQVAPGVNGDYVIFPTSQIGRLSAYNNTNGNLIWNKNLQTDYSSGPFSRSTPAFWREFFFIGTYGAQYVHKIRTSNGELMGSVQVHNHILAMVLCSGTVFGDSYLVGVASQESNNGGNDAYSCCTFAGRFHSINAFTMEIQWTWHSIPPELTGPKSQNKWSGAAIWGSSPSIDAEAGLVFLGTGNNYNENAISNACYAKWPVDKWEVECNQKINPENWFDSVVALDVKSGRKVWARRFEPQDGWNAGCLFTIADTKVNCPKAPFRGPDFDFGMAPALSTFGHGGRKVLYIGQKRGMVYCIDAANGDVIWSTNSSPGGRYGGHSWGIAVDDVNVYLSTINKDQNPWPLVNGTIAHGGGWTALNKITGKQIWTTANPAYYDNSGNDRKRSSWGLAPPLSIGDFLLVGSADDININTGGGGSVYMLDKATGNILQSFETGASVFSGFSADHRCVYVGSGGNINRDLAVGKGAYAWCV